MTRVITIRLEVPDGVGLRVGPPDDEDADELPPSWEPPGRQGPRAVPGGLCPVHGVPWRVVPAGVSRKTGRSYGSFSACSEPGCDERPQAAPRAAS
jgi:hypothetical protein